MHMQIAREAGSHRLHAQRVARVEFRNELPRNVLGKVLKKELRAQCWGGAGHLASSAGGGDQMRDPSECG